MDFWSILFIVLGYVFIMLSIVIPTVYLRKRRNWIPVKATVMSANLVPGSRKKGDRHGKVVETRYQFTDQNDVLRPGTCRTMLYKRKRGTLIKVIFAPEDPLTSETTNHVGLAFFSLLQLVTGLFMLAPGLGYIH